MTPILIYTETRLVRLHTFHAINPNYKNKRVSVNARVHREAKIYTPENSPTFRSIPALSLLFVNSK